MGNCFSRGSDRTRHQNRDRNNPETHQGNSSNSEAERSLENNNSDSQSSRKSLNPLKPEHHITPQEQQEQLEQQQQREESSKKFLAHTRLDLADEKFHVIGVQKYDNGIELYKSIPLQKRNDLLNEYESIQSRTRQTTADVNTAAEHIEQLTKKLETNIDTYKATFEQDMQFMKIAYQKEALTSEDGGEWMHQGALDSQQRRELAQKVIEQMIDKGHTSKELLSIFNGLSKYKEYIPLKYKEAYKKFLYAGDPEKDWANLIQLNKDLETYNEDRMDPSGDRLVERFIEIFEHCKAYNKKFKASADPIAGQEFEEALQHFKKVAERLKKEPNLDYYWLRWDNSTTALHIHNGYQKFKNFYDKSTEDRDKKLKDIQSRLKESTKINAEKYNTVEQLIHNYIKKEYRTSQDTWKQITESCEHLLININKIYKQFNDFRAHMIFKTDKLKEAYTGPYAKQFFSTSDTNFNPDSLGIYLSAIHTMKENLQNEYATHSLQDKNEQLRYNINNFREDIEKINPTEYTNIQNTALTNKFKESIWESMEEQGKFLKKLHDFLSNKEKLLSILTHISVKRLTAHYSELTSQQD